MSQDKKVYNLIALFLLLITAILMFLKAINIIQWSLFWIFSPLWGFTLLVFLITGIYLIVEHGKDKKRL